MTVLEEINRGAKVLERISDTPRLDANILLAYTLDINRASLLASYPEKLSVEQIEKYNNLLKLRSEGYPISYILGEKEFFGLNFHVEDGVLTPRPDSEVLIEEAIKRVQGYGYNTALDMCTGTGCLAISLQHNCPELSVTATDISPIAQSVFKKNNNLVENRVKFIESNLFSGLIGMKFDIIITNPPYLTTKETQDRVDDGWKEPELALDGGEDGLDLIRIIISEAPGFINPGGYLMIEADPAQMETMGELMDMQGFTQIEEYKDLAGFTRIIVGRYE